MPDLSLLLIALFLPLFPLSVPFNLLYQRLPGPLLKGALLLAWPSLGIWLLHDHSADLPGWMSYWALATAGLYAYRSLVVREVTIWAGFMATSAWALLWVAQQVGATATTLYYDALGFSAPLVILGLLVAALERRFGAAYTGIYGGLGRAMPRFSGVLAIVVLAIMATPLFPGFFAMLALVVAAEPGIALALVGIWLLWTWAGARLLQGLIVGEPGSEKTADLGLAQTWVYALALVGLAGLGVIFTGGML